jgi:hypothetical protein
MKEGFAMVKYYRGLVVLATTLMGGCAGVTTSYESLLIQDDDTNTSAVYLTLGDTEQALAVSNGFPGWWGYYPSIMSLSPEIVGVECDQERSHIPFRDPGVIFGGTVCYLTAKGVGEGWILYGNLHTMPENLDSQTLADHKGRIKVIVTEPN